MASRPSPASRSAAQGECAFCAELESQGNILSEHGTVAALLDEYPVSEGHTLVIPKRHTEDILDLTSAESHDAWHLVKTIIDRLRRGDESIRGFNIGGNIGTVAGQTIPHAHIHVIPRREGDTPRPRGGVRGVIPERMQY